MSFPERDERLLNLLGATVLTATDRTSAAITDASGLGGAAPGVLVHLAAYPGESAEALHRVLRISQPGTAQVLATLLAPLSGGERERLTPLLEKIVSGLAGDRPQALTVCRLCDRSACCREPGCPLDHTVAASG